jgi:hypothetical protein
MNITKRFAGVALLAMCQLTPAATPTPRQVLDESDKRTKSDSQYYEGVVRVEGKGKSAREKAWRSWRLGNGGSARAMVQFLEPAEVKGVSLLTLSKPGGEDDQWLYTPELARDRRIAGSAKNERFLGTDFTYEDMQERDLDGSDYRFLAESKCGAAQCWVIESTPKKEKKSQYKRTVVKIRQTDYAAQELLLEKPDGSTRTITYSDYATVDGVLVAKTITLVDPVRESTTTLLLRTVKFHLPVKPEFFTRENLESIHPGTSG